MFVVDSEVEVKFGVVLLPASCRVVKKCLIHFQSRGRSGERFDIQVKLAALFSLQHDEVGRVLFQRLQNQDLGEGAHVLRLNSVLVTVRNLVDTSVHRESTDVLVVVVLHLYDYLLILVYLVCLNSQYCRFPQLKVDVVVYPYSQRVNIFQRRQDAHMVREKKLNSNIHCDIFSLAFL